MNRKFPKQSSPRWILAAWVIPTALLGCVAGAPGDDGNGTGATNSGSAGSGGSDGVGGAGSGGDSVGGTGSGGMEPDCNDSSCDPKSACESSVAGEPLLRRLTARELESTLENAFPAAAGDWSSSLSADPVSHLGFDNEVSHLQVTKQTAREIDETAASLAEVVSGAALETLLPCSQTSADRECAGEFLAKYGKRLFRRPLSQDERNEYLTFFDEALAVTDFAESIGWLTRALVHATPTLYRSEIGTAEGTSRRLDQYEIASELAYTFSGTGPDDALLARADAGELDSPEALVEVAKNLLGTEGGREVIHRFFESALQYGKVTSLTKANVESFPELREQMLQETRRFIEAVIIEGDGGLRELLTSPTTYPSADLAAFYGMSSPGADYDPVERNSGVGLLAQGSVLSTEASPLNSSPTQRGLLIYEKLLCRDVPPVPADVPELPDPVEGETTTRQRYEELHAVEGSNCATCHVQFDPIGFGFEHFDEAGRYRTEESGLPIDASGSVPGTSIEFTNQEELASKLAELPDVHNCLSGQLKTYAFGVEQACLGETKRQEFVDGAIGFVDYLASLAAEPHFTTRKLE